MCSSAYSTDVIKCQVVHIIVIVLQLNFVGVTVEPDRPYVHFPSMQHTFAPVAIGELRSPTQVYELYNGGAVAVNYQLDLSSLSTVKQVSTPLCYK